MVGLMVIYLQKITLNKHTKNMNFVSHHVTSTVSTAFSLIIRLYCSVLPESSFTDAFLRR